MSSTGTAHTLTGSSTSLTFAGQPVATTSAAQTITITNDHHGATVSGVTVSGDFAQTNDCATIASGGSCTVQVTFTPTSAGTKTGTVDITANRNAVTVALSGSGLGTAVSKSTATVAENGATDSYTVALNAAPSADVTITPAVSGPVAVTPTARTFTTTNWATPQSFTVSAAAGIAPGSFSGTVSHTASGGGYGNVPVASLSVSVTGVNDAPSFTKGADPTVTEDAGAKSESGWATGISAGPGESQTLTFTATNNNNALFSTQPAIGATGTLTYTPAANANGIATVSVTLSDDGGTANGGADTSATQTFTLTVTAVNDAPSFTMGANPTVNEGAGAQTISGWATVMSPGPADEVAAGQTLASFAASNDNNALFSAQPAISAAGVLTFTPAADAFGSATVSVTATDSAGATSGAQTFTITVNPVNDAPSFTKGADQSSNEDAGPQSIATWATGLTEGPVNEAPQTLAFLASNDNTALFSSQPAVSSTGTLTYTPASNANGVATVTVQIQDSGGTANGGSDTSAPQTFTITIAAVNDAPTNTVPGAQTVAEDATKVFSAANGNLVSVADVEASSLRVTLSVTSGTLTLSQTTGLTFNSGGSAQASMTFTGTNADVNAALNGLTYAPPANVNGADTLSVTTSDLGATGTGGTLTDADNIAITITPVNDAPSFTKGADQTVNEDAGAQSVAGWATAISPGPADESAQTVSFVVTNSNNALFSSQPAVSDIGVLSFTPVPNANGVATVTVTATDSDGASSAGQSFTITVNPVNDAPSFTKGADVTVDEDAGAQSVPTWATSISAGPANEAGQILTFVVSNDNTALFSSQPAVSSAGALTFSSAANQFGTATVTVRISDDGGASDGGVSQSAPQTFQVSVTAVNDAPTAANDVKATPEDTTLVVSAAQGVLANDADVEGSPLSSVLVTAPSQGSLTLNANGSFSYSPNTNFAGSDSFTYKANDGAADSAPATVTITVNAVNDAPVAASDAYTSNEDTLLSVTAAAGVLSNDADVDSGTLTAVVVAGPASGTLTLATNGSFTYTPAANLAGTVTFTYRASDGTLQSAPATVTITVNAVNDAPSANSQAVSTPEDTAAGITLSGSDVEGSPLTFAVLSGPAQGSLTGTGPSLTYTPNANYTGADSFTYQANDGSLDSAPATVTITVTDVNDAPVATAQSVTTPEDTAKTITLTGSDVDLDALTYTVVSQPTSGTLTGTAPAFTYNPGGNFNGADSFTFKVGDGTTESPTVTISITVTSVNDAPVATPQTVSTPEDTAKAITLAGTDVEGSPLTFTVLSGPAQGSLTGTGPSLTYTPNANYTGADSFTFNANDGALDSAPATVTITVAAVNDAPLATPQGVSTPEDTARAVTLSGSDVDGDALTFTIASGPSQGTLSGTGATRTYTPFSNYNGPDSFTFTSNDGSMDSAPATVALVITPVNDAPDASQDAYSIAEDTTLTIAAPGVLGNDVDVDGDTFQAVLVTPPGAGALSLVLQADGGFTFVPAADFNGVVTFTYKANDGTADSATKTVTITVTPVNDLPTASPVTVTTNEDADVLIALLAADVDADPLSYAIVSPPTHGSVSGTGPSRTYTPDADYFGADAFTYNANDGNGKSTTATVSITVAPVNDAPAATPQNLTLSEDDSVSITLAGTDTESSPLTFAVIAPPTSGILTGTAPALTYTPSADFAGTDSFTFRANDGSVDSPAATITITVTPVNDPPVADADTYAVNPDTPLIVVAAQGVLLGDTDIDFDPLVAEVATPPTNGTLVLAADGSFRYTPNPGFEGLDSFTYVAKDAASESAPATVSIIVNPIPIPNAGTNATIPQATPATLTGTATDDDATLSYLWTQVSGPTVTLATPTELTTTFTTPDGPVVLVFRLAATDPEAATGTDDVTIIVSATITRTVANGTETVSFPASSSLQTVELAVGAPGDVEVQATLFTEAPASFPALPSGSVPALFLEFNVTETGGATIDSARVEFTLSRDWLLENCPFATCIIAVLHHTGTAWETLSATRLGDTTDDPIRYEFTTTSFSPFVPIAVPIVTSGGGGGGGGGTPQTPPVEPIVEPMPPAEVPPAPPPTVSEPAVAGVANEVAPPPATGGGATPPFVRTLNVAATLAVSFLLTAGAVVSIGPRRIRAGAATVGRTATRTARDARHAWSQTQHTIDRASRRLVHAVDAKARLRRFEVSVAGLRRKVMASEQRARSNLASRLAAMREARIVAGELRRARTEFAHRTRIARMEIAARRVETADEALPSPSLEDAVPLLPAFPQRSAVQSRPASSRMTARLQRLRNAPAGLRAGLVAVVSNYELLDESPDPIATINPIFEVADPVTHVAEDLIRSVDEPPALAFADIVRSLVEKIEVVTDRRLDGDPAPSFDAIEPVVSHAPPEPEPATLEPSVPSDVAAQEEAPVVRLARSLWEDVEIAHDSAERGPALGLTEDGYEPVPIPPAPSPEETPPPLPADPIDELTRATNELARNIERSWDNVEIVSDRRPAVGTPADPSRTKSPREVVWGDLSAEMNLSAAWLPREKKTPRTDRDGNPLAPIVLGLLLSYLLGAAVQALRLFA